MLVNKNMKIKSDMMILLLTRWNKSRQLHKVHAVTRVTSLTIPGSRNWSKEVKKYPASPALPQGEKKSVYLQYFTGKNKTRATGSSNWHRKTKEKNHSGTRSEHMLGYNYKETKTLHGACWPNTFRKSPDKNGEGSSLSRPKTGQKLGRLVHRGRFFNYVY